MNRTHLIVFTHACGYYSRTATISFAELQVWLLFRVRLLFDGIPYFYVIRRNKRMFANKRILFSWPKHVQVHDWTLTLHLAQQRYNIPVLYLNTCVLVQDSSVLEFVEIAVYAQFSCSSRSRRLLRWATCSNTNDCTSDYLATPLYWARRYMYHACACILGYSYFDLGAPCC